MIGIVDCGIGNLGSVRNAFEHLGYEAHFCATPGELGRCERLVLPGVGSFRAGMKALESGGWTGAIRAYADSKRPLLGICLGMQLLFERGDEHGPSNGLGLVPGRVVRLTPAPPAKVPHVGWNSLIEVARHPLLEGVKADVDVYFVHSYHCVPTQPGDELAYCDFGGRFVAAVARGNVVGMQFHPEKSQPAGIQILENFVRWDGTC